MGDWQRRLLLRASLGAGFSLPASRLWAQARTPVAAPRRIHLDPGHGGHDPGATGTRGTREKHLTLAAAQDLRRRLAGCGHSVSMTRVTDVFVPLRARVIAAEAAGADLFVSLHADAFDDPAARGASLYTPAAEASDPLAQALADRENAQPAGAPVEAILADLTRAETRGHAVRFARALARGLDARDVALMPGPARHADFVVLRSATIPSVLVEMGFLSSPADEALLLSAAHRERIGAALCAGVDHFLHAAGRRIG